MTQVAQTTAEEQAAQLFCPGVDGNVWFVFHARPRCEKKAAKLCLDLDIHHYLPLHKSTTRKRKRRYSFDIPLFPGYLFGRCDTRERLAVLQSGLLVRTIEVADQHKLLDELYNILRHARNQPERSDDKHGF